jgi:hypothetical protein
MGLYISIQEVKVRLIGKVSFDDSGSDDNTLPTQLAQTLINQAEGDVELDLSQRYQAPFQTDSGQPFNQLPLRPTRLVIKTMCLNKACLYILDTDFGRGSAVSGEEYVKGLSKQYDRLLERCTSIFEDDFRQWKYPPLPSLMLTPSNAASDDGFAGQIYVTGSREGAYAGNNVNDPGHNFWNPGDDECESWLGENFRP